MADAVMFMPISYWRYLCYLWNVVMVILLLLQGTSCGLHQKRFRFGRPTSALKFPQQFGSAHLVGMDITCLEFQTACDPQN